MPIEFDCKLCGRRVKAPEALAGKKARCPQCQGIVDVPEPVFQAEEIPMAPLIEEHSGDPPQGGFFNENQDETGARRACPMCGEMILAAALKCRFCGEVFDSSLRQGASNPRTRHDFNSAMTTAGSVWCLMGTCVSLVGLFVGAAAEGRGRGQPEMNGLVAIVVLIIGVVFLTAGICTASKQIWAAYLGLVMSYLWLLLTVVGLLTGGAGGGGGADPAIRSSQTCFTVLFIGLMILAIVSAHRAIGLSNLMNRAR